MVIQINDLSAHADALCSSYGELRALHLQSCYEQRDHIGGPVDANAMPAAPGNQAEMQAVGLGTN